MVCMCVSTYAYTCMYLASMWNQRTTLHGEFSSSTFMCILRASFALSALYIECSHSEPSSLSVAISSVYSAIG